MTCRRFEESIVDRARGVALRSDAAAALSSHLESCTQCAARFERERQLSLALKAVALETAGDAASNELAGRLLDAFSAHHASLARRRSWSPAWLASAAAVLLIAGAGAWMAKVWSPVGSGISESREDALAGFVALPVAAGLPLFESGTIVRVDVPVAALPSYGVEPVADRSRMRVQADVLVGQDGQPRAIRFVNDRGFAVGAFGGFGAFGALRSRP